MRFHLFWRWTETWLAFTVHHAKDIYEQTIQMHLQLPNLQQNP
jgi:hypothetical protein